jgi:hypothetical protein
MPFPAPVISATLPLKSIVSSGNSDCEQCHYGEGEAIPAAVVSTGVDDRLLAISE